jgi:subtilisin family serine protease
MQRYIVAFNKGIDSGEIATTLKVTTPQFADACDHLIQCTKGLDPKDILHFPEIGVVSKTLSENEAEQLRNDPRVTSVRMSREMVSTPFVEKLGDARVNALVEAAILPWHVQLVNADKCWTKTTGKGVKVGVIDSEIDKDLPYLPIVEGASFHPDAPDWFGTDDFHGTFCAGIIGCRNTNPAMVGIAPDCDLYALRVNKNNSGRSEYIAAAMMWAARKNLDMVSLSQWDPNGAADPHEPPWDGVGRASDLLAQSGCIVIGIAGNSGALANHWVSNPGRCPKVVAVGATNRDLTWWDQSSYGPADLPEDSSVEITAPGNDILSIFPGGKYGLGHGTSFAAPQVAGACALMKQLRHDLTSDQMRTRVKQASRDLGPAGRDEKFGAGFLDCEKAVSNLIA